MHAEVDLACDVDLLLFGMSPPRSLAQPRKETGPGRNIDRRLIANHDEPIL